MDRAELKCRARAQLGNKLFGNTWLYAVVICLIYNLLAGNVIVNFVEQHTTNGTVTMIFNIAALFLAGPINYGTAFIFLKQAREGGRADVADLLKGFKEDFIGLFLLNFMQTLFIALWSLLLVVPGIVAAYSYAMSYYIRADHPDYDWKQCITESKRMMKGHRMELFIFDLSYIGWFIVGAICLGIGSLWVDAYFKAGHAQFYERLKNSPAVYC